VEDESFFDDPFALQKSDMIVNTPTSTEIIKYVVRKSGKDYGAIKAKYASSFDLLTFMKATLDVPLPKTEKVAGSNTTEVSYKIRAISENMSTLLPNITSSEAGSTITYLDHGCGDGKITMEMADILEKAIPSSHVAVHGIDIYRHASLPSSMTYSAPASDGKINYDDDYFDVITCLLSLHHVPKSVQEFTIAELTRVLKPGGTLIIYEHDVASTAGQTMTKSFFNLRMYLDAVHMTFMFYGDKNERSVDREDPRLLTNNDVTWIFESTYHPRQWYIDHFTGAGLVEGGYYHEKNRQMMYYESFIKPSLLK